MSLACGHLGNGGHRGCLWVQNFSTESHVASAATYVNDRCYARQRIKTRSSPRHLLSHCHCALRIASGQPRLSTTTPLAEVRAFFREALLLGDRRFPAVRYRGRIFALSAAFAQAPIQALLSALSLPLRSKQLVALALLRSSLACFAGSI